MIGKGKTSMSNLTPVDAKLLRANLAKGKKYMNNLTNKQLELLLKDTSNEIQILYNLNKLIPKMTHNELTIYMEQWNIYNEYNALYTILDSGEYNDSHDIPCELNEIYEVMCSCVYKINTLCYKVNLRQN